MDLISKLYADSLECNVKFAWEHKGNNKVMIVVENDILSENLNWFLGKIKDYKEQYNDITFTKPETYKGLKPDWEKCLKWMIMYNTIQLNAGLVEIDNKVKSMLEKV